MVLLFQFLIVFLLSITVAPFDHHSSLPHPYKVNVARSIQNYLKPRLQMRDRYERKTKYENTVLRKADFDNEDEIPVYIITSTADGKRIKRSHDSDEGVKNIFDENGMLYLTQPIYHSEDEAELKNVIHSIKRRNAVKHSNKKKLRDMVNDELNKRLLEINEKYPPQVDFGNYK